MPLGYNVVSILAYLPFSQNAIIPYLMVVVRYQITRWDGESWRQSWGFLLFYENKKQVTGFSLLYEHFVLLTVGV